MAEQWNEQQPWEFTSACKGIVVRHAMTKMRDSVEEPMSSSDVSVRDWSHRPPWLSHQEFPKLKLSASDCFDCEHFSASKVCREWNANP